MIKINLAERKQFSLDSKQGATGLNSLSNIDVSELLDFIKEPAIRSFLLFLIVTWGATSWLDKVHEEELVAIDKKIAAVAQKKTTVQIQLNQMTELENQKKALENDEKEIKRKLLALSELAAGRGNMHQVLLAVSKSIPPGVWLSTLNLSAQNYIINGQANDLNLVADFTKNLQETAYFKDIEAKKTTSSTDDKTGIELTSFEMGPRSTGALETGR